jgi:uncharacterized protein (TIGR02001 family)
MMKRCMYMRSTFITITVALLFLMVSIAPILAEEAKPAAAVPAQAAVAPAPEEEKPTADFSVSALSKYVWRGYEQTRDSIVVQPSLTVGYKGFSANLWSNLDTKPYSSIPGRTYSGNWTETDLTLSYSKTFGPVNVGGGYIYYGLNAPYSGAPDPLDSQEIYVTIGLNTLLSPTLTVYKEIDHYHQWYALLAVSHTFELSKIISLKLAASASYLLSEDADKYPKYNSDSIATSDKFSNFHDGVVSVSLPIAPVKYITITPTVSYVFPLSNDAKYEMKALGKQGTARPSDRDSSYLYGGLTFNFAF